VKESLQGPLNSAKLRKIAGIKTFSVVTGTHGRKMLRSRLQAARSRPVEHCGTMLLYDYKDFRMKRRRCVSKLSSFVYRSWACRPYAFSFL